MKIKLFYISCFLCLFSTAFAQSTTETSSASSTSESSGIFSNFFKKEKWGISYFNYMNGPSFANGNGVSINHYLTIRHRITNDWALSVTIRPNTNIANGGETFSMGDSYIRLNIPTLFQNDMLTISGQVTYYAPLSDSSKRAKLLGRISPKIYASSSFGKFGFMYILIPTVYLNATKEEGQRIAAHGHWISTSYSLSDRYTLDFSIYPSWSYSRGQDVYFNNVPIYPGLSIRFNQKLSVSTYLEVILGDPRWESTSAGASFSYNFL